MKYHYVVNYSGGLCSWFAAKRTVERYGPENVTLLFADTNFEHEDLYRFVDESVKMLGCKFVRVADGRTPWDVFFDERYLGNSRVDPCSKILKRALLDKWRDKNCDPARTVMVIGMGYGERKRYIRFRARCRARGWKVEAPAMAPPYTDKAGMIQACLDAGLEPPELYDYGFAHNNCGGFCIKSGQKQFRLLLFKRRDFYLFNENKEEALRKYLGKDVAIMRDRSGGISKPLTLRVFREKIEGGQICSVPNDDGGCGCAIDDDEDTLRKAA